MANTLKVHEREAILNLVRLRWPIRKIARELGLSRNTVRGHVRALGPVDVEAMTERIMASSPPGSPGSVAHTDPLSTPGSPAEAKQTDPLSTAGNYGRKSLCEVHADLILAKVEAGVTAQRIYQDLQTEGGFAGSYQSVKRYVHRLRQTDPELVHRIEVQPGEEVQVDFGKGPVLIGADGRKRKTRIFRLVLSFSRKGYSEAVLDQTTETFLRCLENAFLSFGGATLPMCSGTPPRPICWSLAWRSTSSVLGSDTSAWKRPTATPKSICARNRRRWRPANPQLRTLGRHAPLVQSGATMRN